jgi:hypothetical protein
MKDTPQFDDPIVRSLVPLVEALSTVNGTLILAYGRAEHKPSSLRRLMEDIHIYDDIYSFSRRWSYDLDFERENLRLFELVDGFDEVKEEFGRASAATKALAVALDKTQDEQSFESMHATVYSGFVRFCERMELVGPEHLLLQEHFTQLVLLGREPSFGQNGNELYQFEAVARLRDEFFTSKKPGLLKAYLEQATLLKQTTEYLAVYEEKKPFWKPFSAHVANEAKLMTQLEVMSLLEEIS